MKSFAMVRRHITVVFDWKDVYVMLSLLVIAEFLVKLELRQYVISGR